MEYQQKPIFIHSLFRSGSTYIFNVFRRSDCNYYCYQEPFNEQLLLNKGSLFNDIDNTEQINKKLHHPLLNKPYFYEFGYFRDEIGKTFNESIPYANFFIRSEEQADDIKSYIQLLIDRAKGRPVLQFCGSTFRSDWLHENFNAVRIFLFRNPRDQWESYRLNTYFPAINLMYFLAEKSLPEFIIAREELRLEPYQNGCIEDQINYCRYLHLTDEDRYFIFYLIWSLSYLKNQPNADIMFDIDLLSSSASYRQDTLNRLNQFGISGIDFSDCAIRNYMFSDEENSLFSNVERRVRDFLSIRCGYSESDIFKLEKINSTFSAEKVLSFASELWLSRMELNKLRNENLELERNLYDFHLRLKDRDSQIIVLDEQLRMLDDQITMLNGQLREIFNSYRWKFTNPIVKLIELMTNITKRGL